MHFCCRGNDLCRAYYLPRDRLTSPPDRLAVVMIALCFQQRRQGLLGSAEHLARTLQELTLRAPPLFRGLPLPQRSLHAQRRRLVSPQVLHVLASLVTETELVDRCPFPPLLAVHATLPAQGLQLHWD